jgi:tetratricopeptide (TPR) repeat protein
MLVPPSDWREDAPETLWETFMRLTPASIALAGLLAIGSSAAISQKPAAPVPANPAAEAWKAEGASARARGDFAAANDAYEVAMLLNPRDSSIMIALAGLARSQQLPGKAIRYYEQVLRDNPNDLTALQGEGLAMVDKGALESARQTLAKLQAACKRVCTQATELSAAISRGAPRVVTAEATKASATN